PPAEARGVEGRPPLTARARALDKLLVGLPVEGDERFRINLVTFTKHEGFLDPYRQRKIQHTSAGTERTHDRRPVCLDEVLAPSRRGRREPELVPISRRDPADEGVEAGLKALLVL